MKKLTITIYTKAKRVQEFIRVLQPLVQIGETIEHQIEDVEVEKKQESGEKLHKKVTRNKAGF